MESPSTKRAYAATLAASLGVANEEVGVGSKMAISPSMVVSEKCEFNSIKNRDVLVLKMKCPFFGKSARESMKMEANLAGCLPQDQMGQLAKWRYKAKHFMGK